MNNEGLRSIGAFICATATLVLVTFIYFNALAWAFNERDPVLVLGEVFLWPLVLVVWPFVAPDDSYAWPFAPGTSLIPFMVVMVLAFIGFTYLNDD